MKTFVYIITVLSGVFAFLSLVCVVNGNLSAIPVAIALIGIFAASGAISDKMEKNDASQR